MPSCTPIKLAARLMIRAHGANALGHVMSRQFAHLARGNAAGAAEMARVACEIMTLRPLPGQVAATQAPVATPKKAAKTSDSRAVFGGV